MTPRAIKITATTPPMMKKRFHCSASSSRRPRRRCATWGFAFAMLHSCCRRHNEGLPPSHLPLLVYLGLAARDEHPRDADVIWRVGQERQVAGPFQRLGQPAL